MLLIRCSFSIIASFKMYNFVIYIQFNSSHCDTKNFSQLHHTWLFMSVSHFVAELFKSELSNRMK